MFKKKTGTFACVATSFGNLHIPYLSAPLLISLHLSWRVTGLHKQAKQTNKHPNRHFITHAMKLSSETPTSYGAVPFGVPVVDVVEGSPSVVKVVAPADLPEGYEYQVEALGHFMMATVVSTSIVGSGLKLCRFRCVLVCLSLEDLLACNLLWWWFDRSLQEGSPRVKNSMLP